MAETIAAASRLNSRSHQQQGKGPCMLRIAALAISTLLLASAQDQSRAIQAQQEREAQTRGEQQRRELIRQDREREVRAREEQDLAVRRRTEAQAEQQRQLSRTDVQSAQAAAAPDTVVRKTVESNGAGSSMAPNSHKRQLGIALMAFAAFSIVGILVRRFVIARLSQR